MSVSISYQPIEDKKYLRQSLESVAIALRETFGDFPVILSRDDYKILLAMAVVWGEHNDNNPYLQLAEAMENRGEIIVDVEY